MKLTWYGPVWTYSGYATHNRKLIAELVKLGWDINLVGTENNLPTEVKEKELLITLEKKPKPAVPEGLCINLIPPPALGLYGDYTILYSTLESETVHEGWLMRAKMYDEIWVPCRMNYRTLRDAGVPRKKLFIMPEGVDTETFNPGAGADPRWKSIRFTFLYCGDWSYRKGIQVLIPAYLKSFSERDNVRLLLNTNYQGNKDKKAIARINEEIDFFRWKYNLTSKAKIEIIDRWLSEKDLSRLYNSADCYVCPTLGEAWGLPIIEAAACGRPIISTEGGGQADFCVPRWSNLIKIEKKDTIDDKVKCDVDFYREQIFSFPSVDDLILKMWWVYIHRGDARKKALKLMKHIHKKFTWARVARKIDRRLKKLGGKIGKATNQKF